MAELGKFAAAAAAADVGGEVVAENAAGVARGRWDAARLPELRRMRVDSCDCAQRMTARAVSSCDCLRDAVDVEEAARAIGGGIHQDFVDHRVGDEFAIAGLERVGERW